MKPLHPILLGAAALVGLLAAIWSGADLPVRVALKGGASAMFVLTALLVPRPDSAYFRFIVAGLVFGLVGDVLLEIGGETLFMVGLVAFLIGHLFYALAFFGQTPINKWITLKQLPIWLISLGVAYHLAPHAGGMLIPVLAYVFVITVMVSGALALPGNGGLSRRFFGLALAASILFYGSDYLVARNAFIGRTFLNTLILLPAYYAAQFMFAWSVGLAGTKAPQADS